MLYPVGLPLRCCAVIAAGLALAAPNLARAGTLTVLYSFNPGRNGQGPSYPIGRLFLASNGAIYGVTTNGGDNQAGSVYALSPQGALSVVHSFTSTEGTPAGGVIGDAAGHLFGLTQNPAAANGGEVYELLPGGGEQTIALLPPGPTRPDGELAFDGTSRLVGASYLGGAFGEGDVFQVAAGTGVTTLASLDQSNGANAQGPVLVGKNGTLFGATFSDGPRNGLGEVFALSPSGVMTVLHTFTDGPASCYYPEQGLAADAAGNLYGVTEASTGGQGCVYKLGRGGGYTVLHSFMAPGLFSTAFTPVIDSSGTLWGTAASGGSANDGGIYSITPDGTETDMVAFTGANGEHPDGGLVQDAAGNFYGVTSMGGLNSAGVIYKFTP